MKQRRNSENDRGAVMVIALFLAIFLLGLLYYVVGVTQTVFFREHLQDTADGAALSSAVMHARSMNLLVLINIVMAALLAILVTIKLVEGLAIIGMVIAAVLAWFTGGSTLAAIPPLKTVQANMDAAYQQVQPPIFSALEALHSAAGVVAEVAPRAADLTVLADITANAQPPGSRGLAAGTRATLPVSDDSFSKLCGEAGTFPIELAKEALSPLPGVSGILGELEGPMSDMTSSLSNWFCGDGNSPPPPYTREEKRAYPRMPLALSCEAEHPDASGDLTLGAGKTSPTCEESKRFEADAVPDTNSGKCQPGRDCSARGPYEQRAARARVECNPARSPRPSRYLYQQREGSVQYRWTGKLWQRLDPTFGEPVLVGSDKDHPAGPPCGPKQVRPSVAEGYEEVVRKSNDVSELRPVCSNEVAPVRPTRGTPVNGSVETVHFTEVTHILGCQKVEQVEVRVSGGKSGGSDSNNKNPQRVIDGATLGDENFQIRALMQGNSSTITANQMVQLTLWDHKAPNDTLRALRELGNYSVAQAEYFYDGTDDAGEWMWNMKWRARLRRFRLPEGEALAPIQAACGATLGSGCGGLLSSLSRVGDLVVH